MARIITASEAEYVGHFLEAAIRERVRWGKWYRRHRIEQQRASLSDHLVPLERANEIVLRELLKVRREALQAHRAESERIARWADAAVREMELHILPEPRDPVRAFTDGIDAEYGIAR